MNQAAHDKVTRARAALIIEQPFFGTLALRLKMRQDTSINTFATDGIEIVYNPDYTMTLRPGQVKMILCHEVMHCALDHLGRMGAKDLGRWNRACDYPINEILSNMKMDMADNILLEKAFFGMSAEHIYSILPPEDPNNPAPDHMLPPQTPQSPTQQAAQALEWKIATAQAAQSAKMAGKLPGSLEQFVDNLLDTRVDWRTMLRQFITTANESDYSWLKPNRMMLGGHGIYLPGLFTEKTKPLAVVKDISGSINDEIQDAFNAELRGIHQDLKPEELHVFYVDTRVARYDKIEPDGECKLVNIRGGGTRFEPAFEEIEKQGIEPACLIYLTDMEGSFPANPPPYPVLWVTIDKNSSSPPFGDMTCIEV